MSITERIDLVLDQKPERDAIIAAEVRQITRAREAHDRVAMWSAAWALRIGVCSLFKDLLSADAGWNSDGRWLDRISGSELTLEPLGRCVVSGSAIWGLSEDVGGHQWAAPVEADLRFLPGYTEMVGYTIRFGDQRAFPDEEIVAAIQRIPRDIESGSIEWAYEFRRLAPDDAGGGAASDPGGESHLPAPSSG